MKRLLICLSAAWLMAALAVSAEEEKQAGHPAGGRAAARGAPDAGRMLGAFGVPGGMAEKLNLTEDQKQKAMEIVKRYMPQMQELRKKMNDEFDAMLTGDQKKALEEAREQLRQRLQQNRPQGGARRGAADANK